MWRKFIDILFWLSAALYLGGMIAIGAIVAPAIFTATKNNDIVLPNVATPPLDATRQAGGEIFGEVLYRFSYIEYACLALLLICLIVWLATTRLFRRSTWIMAALWAIIASLTLYDSISLTPRVWSTRTLMRAEAPTHAAEGLDATWPAQSKFNALHQQSELIGHLKVYALLGMVLMAAWRGPPSRRRSGAMLNEAMRSRRR